MTISWRALKDARARKGWTQQQLAEAIDVHAKTIVNWEKSGVPPKSEYKIRRALGQDIDYAVFIDGLPSNQEPISFEEWRDYDDTSKQGMQDDFDRDVAELGHEEAVARWSTPWPGTEEMVENFEGAHEARAERVEVLSQFGSTELLDELARRIQSLEMDVAANVTPIRPRLSFEELDAHRSVAKKNATGEELDPDAD